MNFDRFEFELQIMKVYGMLEMLDTITEGALEYNWTSDQVANATIGLKEMLNVEMDKIHRQLNDGILQGKIV